jgi:hypothetical protein
MLHLWLLIVLLSNCSLAASSSPIPTLFIHGLFNECNNTRLQNFINLTRETGAYADCLEVGGSQAVFASAFESTMAQVQQYCEQFRAHPVFGSAPVLNIVGTS